jgi:hypothetical protein
VDAFPADRPRNDLHRAGLDWPPRADGDRPRAAVADWKQCCARQPGDRCRSAIDRAMLLSFLLP